MNALIPSKWCLLRSSEKPCTMFIVSLLWNCVMFPREHYLTSVRKTEKSWQRQHTGSDVLLTLWNIFSSQSCLQGFYCSRKQSLGFAMKSSLLTAFYLPLYCHHLVFSPNFVVRHVTKHWYICEAHYSVLARDVLVNNCGSAQCWHVSSVDGACFACSVWLVLSCHCDIKFTRCFELTVRQFTRWKLLYLICSLLIILMNV